jgi:hypothetical protein
MSTVRSTPSRPAGVAERVLALQRTVGNAAVTQLLRSPVEAPADALPLDDKSTTTLSLEGIGSFPIESMSTQVRRQVPRDYEEKETTTVVEWHITKRHDAYSNALFKANLDGKNIPLAEVTLERGSAKVVLKLRNAMITNFSSSSVSGETFDSFTLEGELVK